MGALRRRLVISWWKSPGLADTESEATFGVSAARFIGTAYSLTTNDLNVSYQAGPGDNRLPPGVRDLEAP